ncbi:MAG: 4Fe-4S dicluster domain-containing protein [Actinomycetota bacterium]
MDAPPVGLVVLDRGGLDSLIVGLAKKGYRVIGPTVVDDAVVYDDISSTKDMPAGLGDEQRGGHYRLKKRKDGALFGYTVSPQGWKRFLFPPRQKLFAAKRSKAGFDILPPDKPEAPMAFIGVRACELAAMAVQDRVFGDKAYGDSGYQRRRREAFVVAVECGEAGEMCFCASMGTGPEVKAGFDLKLVELPARELFVVQAGSERGLEMVKALKAPTASIDDANAAIERVGKIKFTKKMDAAAAKTLAAKPEHARWDDVAKRCLTCGNCTMVCPTCFCSTVEDVTDLKGDNAERWRRWDSCFSVEFSYIHGGSIRNEARSRYRQWITHKLSAWHDQFGTSGCVGCGRCITWCPVGIDITEEVRAVKASEKGK